MKKNGKYAYRNRTKITFNRGKTIKQWKSRLQNSGEIVNYLDNSTENGTMIWTVTSDPNVISRVYRDEGSNRVFLTTTIGISLGCGVLAVAFSALGTSLFLRAKKQRANGTMSDSSYVQEAIYSEPYENKDNKITQDIQVPVCTPETTIQTENDYINDIKVSTPIHEVVKIKSDENDELYSFNKAVIVKDGKNAEALDSSDYIDSLLPKDKYSKVIRTDSDSAYYSLGNSLEGILGQHKSQDSIGQSVCHNIEKRSKQHQLLPALDVSSDSPFYVEDILTEEGGRLELPAYRVTMFVPPGAIPKGTRQRIFMYVHPDTTHVSASMNKQGQIISPFIICGPDGFKFENMITLSYPHYVTRLKDWQVKTIYTKTTNNQLEYDFVDEDPSSDALVQKENITLFLSHFTGFGTIGQQHSEASPRGEMYWKTILILASQIIEGEDLILYIWCIDSNELESVLTEEEQQGKMRVSTNPFQIRIDPSEEHGTITASLVDVDKAWSVYGPSLKEDNMHEVAFTELFLRPRDSKEMSLEAKKIDSRPNSTRGSLFNLDERNDLVDKLDTNENTICGNDWRILASYLSLSEKDVEQIQKHSHRQSPTWKMLNFLELTLRNPGIQDIKDLLGFFKGLPKKQSRIDVERILEDAILRIQKEADISRTGIVRPTRRAKIKVSDEEQQDQAIANSPALKVPILPGSVREPTEQSIDGTYLAW
ncbi:unnamed protein product [Owenia fusiformis]|uniref:Netrin receptor UNC5 n=1 Tax=Owenia fusiformis TaxID=6347 RepID=A0A8S4MVG6_OWEFU|nr:unnamed protein product [Owenia fusiformis]